MMQTDPVRIPFEQNLGKELYDLMEGELPEEILKEGKTGKKEIAQMLANGIQQKFLPRMYH